MRVSVYRERVCVCVYPFFARVSAEGVEGKRVIINIHHDAVCVYVYVRAFVIKRERAREIFKSRGRPAEGGKERKKEREYCVTSKRSTEAVRG